MTTRPAIPRPEAGTRIRLNDRCVWPERRGCLGHVAAPTAGETDVYPWHGLGADEVVVKLDDDPLAPPDDSGWTCVTGLDSIDVIT